MNIIAQNIRKSRKQLGWSQADLANAAGVSQQLISQIERGVNEKTNVLPQLARALGKPLHELDPTFIDLLVHQGLSSSRVVLQEILGLNPEGLGESDAEAYIPKSPQGDTGAGKDVALSSHYEALVNAARLIAPECREPSIMRMIASMPTLSLLSGDFLVVDLGRTEPSPGATVVAQAFERDPDFLVTLVREYYPGSLISREPGRHAPYLPLPASDVGIIATVVGVIRAPRPSRN